MENARERDPASWIRLPGIEEGRSLASQASAPFARTRYSKRDEISSKRIENEPKAHIARLFSQTPSTRSSLTHRIIAPSLGDGVALAGRASSRQSPSSCSCFVMMLAHSPCEYASFTSSSLSALSFEPGTSFAVV